MHEFLSDLYFTKRGRVNDDRLLLRSCIVASRVVAVVAVVNSMFQCLFVRTDY